MSEGLKGPTDELEKRVHQIVDSGFAALGDLLLDVFV
jgi:hypothetical protein